MLRKPILTMCLALSGLWWQVAAAAEPLPPATQWVPADAIVALEFSQPKDLLDVVLDPQLAEAVTSMPVYQKQAAQPEFRQFLGVVNYLEMMIATDWQTALRGAIGGGVTLAANAGGDVLLIVDAKDEKTLGQLHELFLGFARGEADKQGHPDRVTSKEYRGVTGWTFGGDEAHAIVGNRLVLSNKPAALRAALDLRADPNGASLASLPAYQAAKEAAGADAAATLFVNLAALKVHPHIQKALAKDPEPAASLLIPGVTEALRGSNWAAAGLHVEGKKLKLRAVVDGETGGASGPAPYAYSPQPDEGALPNLSVPRQIAGMSLYRDLHKFYAAKDELFPERTSGLIFFENMMGIFFSGRDLTEEVLAETMPDIRVVVAQQEYDPAVGIPQLQLPSFAAVFRLRDPQRFGQVVEEAWQKAVGLINFTRGQQAHAGLIIDRPTHGGTTFTAAHFASSGKADSGSVDSQYNFRPSVAMPGEYLILSSTEALACDLIDALNKEAAAPVKGLPQVHSLVNVDILQLASILGANRDNMVRQNMLEKGSSQEQAETQIDLLVTALKYLGGVQLSLGRHDERAEAIVQMELDLP